METDLPRYPALAREAPYFTPPARSVAKIRPQIHRPANLARSAFHCLTGIFALTLIQLAPHGVLVAMAVSAAVGCWFLELTRQRIPWINAACMWVLGRFAHPHEKTQVNSSTWYSTALALMAVFFSAHANSVGVIILGFGDPIAALVGRRFGRTRLPGGRSLEGSIAFGLAAGLAGLAALRICYPHESMLLSLGAAGAGAIAGAIAEVLSPVDDNFAIPVAASLAALVVGFA
jgi:dolichol kinase